jgi:hypothetical protein
MFDKVSSNKNIIRKKGRRIAEYTDQKSEYFPNDVQFILTKDELYDNKYKLFFRAGV